MWIPLLRELCSRMPKLSENLESPMIGSTDSRLGTMAKECEVSIRDTVKTSIFSSEI